MLVFSVGAIEDKIVFFIFGGLVLELFDVCAVDRLWLYPGFVYFTQGGLSLSRVTVYNLN